MTQPVIKTNAYLVMNKQNINNKTCCIAKETQIVSKLSGKNKTHRKKEKAVREKAHEVKRWQPFKYMQHKKQLQNKTQQQEIKLKRTHRNLSEIMLQISANEAFMESFSSTAPSGKILRLPDGLAINQSIDQKAPATYTGQQSQPLVLSL